MTATLRMTEQQLQDAVAELARTLGWKVAHFRPARTSRGWRTPVAYDGQGFPDLILARHTILFVELKTSRGKVTPEQEHWLGTLSLAGGRTHVWGPADWTSGRVESVLRETHTLHVHHGAP